MTHEAMYFIGSDGNVLRLGHVVPRDNELCHSTDGGQTFEELIFTSMWGEHFTSHTRVNYLIWKTQADKEEGDRSKGEPLLLRDGVITYKDVTYHVDKNRRGT